MVLIKPVFMFVVDAGEVTGYPAAGHHSQTYLQRRLHLYNKLLSNLPAKGILFLVPVVKDFLGPIELNHYSALAIVA